MDIVVKQANIVLQVVSRNTATAIHLAVKQ
jgi:hypothetical protein